MEVSEGRTQIIIIYHQHGDRLFPGNEFDILQTADSFVKQKINAAWRKGWEVYKGKRIRQEVEKLLLGKVWAI